MTVAYVALNSGLHKSHGTAFHICCHAPDAKTSINAYQHEWVQDLWFIKLQILCLSLRPSIQLGCGSLEQAPRENQVKAVGVTKSDWRLPDQFCAAIANMLRKTLACMAVSPWHNTDKIHDCDRDSHSCCNYHVFQKSSKQTIHAPDVLATPMIQHHIECCRYPREQAQSCDQAIRCLSGIDLLRQTVENQLSDSLA